MARDSTRTPNRGAEAACLLRCCSARRARHRRDARGRVLEEPTRIVEIAHDDSPLVRSHIRAIASDYGRRFAQQSCWSAVAVSALLRTLERAGVSSPPMARASSVQCRCAGTRTPSPAFAPSPQAQSSSQIRSCL